MTWLEFKTMVEQAGVQEDDRLEDDRLYDREGFESGDLRARSH